MAVKYKVIQRGQPGVTGGGQKKYYATSVADGEKDLEQLTKMIEKISTVSGADIRGVLYSLVDVMTDNLADGEIVRLGDLGSLRMSISSEGCQQEKDVTASSIKSNKVIFTPGKKIKDMIKTVSYEKA